MLAIEVFCPKIFFIEKPTTDTTEHAETKISRAKEKKCALAINYSRRYDQRNRKLKAEIDSGVFGGAIHARVIYGKGLLNSGPHLVDLIRFWSGESENILWRASVWGPDRDTTESFDLRYSDQFRVSFDAFDERITSVTEIHIWFEKSRIRLRDGGRYWEFSEVKQSVEYSGHRNYYGSNRENTDGTFKSGDGSFKGAMENFTNFLEFGEPLLCNAHNALETLKCAGAIQSLVPGTVQ